MRPLIAIVSGTALALAAAADPTFPGQILSIAIPTAWAQQERGRGHGHDDKEDDDKERGNRHGQDEDRGHGHGKGKGDRDDGDGDGDDGGGRSGRHDTDDGPDGEGPRGGPGPRDPRAGDPAHTAPGADVEIADRGLEQGERGLESEREGEFRDLANRFDLDETETFDDDGFLARRAEILALSTNPELDRRAAALGLMVAERQAVPSLASTVYRLRVPAASSIDGVLARLRADDPDGVFDRNHLYDGSAGRGVSSATVGKHSVALIDPATGVSLGLIDTGVDVLHPALRGSHIEMRFFVEESRALPEAHGTAVASLLVSPEAGVLPGAQLYVAGVFYEDRRGGLLSEAEDLVRALDWLIERRAPVINMSLSGPPNEVLRAAIARAVGAGHLIVAAVGNAGPASPPLYPAAYEGVIAVTAVDSERHVYRRASRGAHVELAALGVDVLAAAPDGLAVYSGTSFASPYVAALAALEHRSLDRAQAVAARESLRGNAMDLGKPGRDDVYGFGLAQPRTLAPATAAR